MGLVTRARRLMIDLLRANQSRTLGLMWLSGISSVTASPGPLARRCVDEIQPEEPIRGDNSLPGVEIVIACSPKDFDLLPATVTFCMAHVRNAVSAVTVVVPDVEVEAASRLGTPADVAGEDALLPPALRKAVREHHPAGRYGWVLQQVIGLYFAWSSESAGVLVLDSDTILTRPRAFLGRDRRQLLSLSHEYFEPYEDHATKVWGPRKRHHGLSYVTHHQLMQPWILREMFPNLDDLAQWVKKAATDHKSPLADYHSYGRWLCDHYPENVSLARWGNKSVARSSFVSLDPESLQRELSSRFPHYFSVSLHSYLQ